LYSRAEFLVLIDIKRNAGSAGSTRGERLPAGLMPASNMDRPPERPI